MRDLSISRRLTLALAALAASATGCADTPVPTSVAPSRPALLAAVAALPPVRISEIHYDNQGTDTGEAVEVSFPTGTDLTGWRIVRYNGSVPTAAVIYATPAPAAGSSETLSALTPTACTGGGRSVVVVRYLTDGLQNGTADGLALVNGTQVVELLSYEGTFTVSGAAAVGAGLASTDIGVAEAGTESTSPAVQSLKRNGAGVWSTPSANSFGVCNDSDETPAPVVESVTVNPPSATIVAGSTQAFTATARDASSQTIAGVTFTWSSDNIGVATVDPSSGVVSGVAAGTATITAKAPNNVIGSASVTVTAAPGGGTGATNVRISEFHYDNDGADVGEAIEVEGDANGSLAGWSLVLYTGSNGTTYGSPIPLSGTIPATCSARGVVVVNLPVNGLQNGGLNASEPDGIALVNASNQVVEFISYEGAFTATNGPASGLASTNIGVDEDPAPAVGQSVQRAGNGVWFGPAAATFGSCNAATPPVVTSPGANTISFTGRNQPNASSDADPPLPIGYQDQLFATVRDANGTVVPNTPVTWSVDPSTPFATVDANGVVTGIAEGTATIRATALNGASVGTYPVPVKNPPDGPAVYGNHLEFGRPVDATPADELLVTWPEFVSSFNAARGQPNWIAYNLEQTHRGPADRCECFTADPSLPAGTPVITTNDYTGSGFSRGHMVMSEDRTSGDGVATPPPTSVDNARTFLFSNIIPQTSQNNGGPWLTLETYLGNLAEAGASEIYIYAGGTKYDGTLKNEGKVAIPTRTWKVAIVLGRDQGLANVQSPSDIRQVIAVDIPNTTTVSGSWENFRVSVDSVQRLTGYDFLSALPEAIECKVEVRNCLAQAAVATPSTVTAGQAATIALSWEDADGTTDAPFKVVIEWGDGTSVTGTYLSAYPSSRPLARQKTWSAPGTYTVKVTITDKRGGTSVTTKTVVVS